VVELDANTLEKRTVIKVAYHIDTLAVSGIHFAIGGVPFLPKEVGADRAIVEGYTLDGKKIGSASVPTVTEYLRYGSNNASGVSRLDIASDGMTVVVSTFWQDGFGHDSTASSIAQVYSLSDGKLIRNLAPGSWIYAAHFDTAHQNNVVLEVSGYKLTYEAATGARLEAVQQLFHYGRMKMDGGGEIDEVPDELVVTMPGNPPLRQAFADNLVGVAPFPALNIVVALTRDGELEFSSLNGLQPIVTIAPGGGGEWLAFTPSGDYDASPHGTDGAFWIAGDQLSEFATLKAKHEKPGLVEHLLAAAHS
jgi:hypothetical protein